MNKEAQDQFNELLKLDPNSLTAENIKFLNARRDYLTDEQKAVLDKLPQQLEEANENRNADGETEVNTAESAAEVTGAFTNDEEDAEPSTDYNSMKVEELKDILQSRKIEFDSSAKKADLVSLLENADK